MNRYSGMRLALPIAMALLATGGWLLSAVGRDDPLLGLPEVQTGLDAFAEMAGGIAAVLLLGRLILGTAGTHATGFQRVIIYMMLTFLASFLVMRHFGFDPRAIITTSAILTVAIGFAVQPSLATMIAGFTLHMDGIVKPGDGLMHDGELLRVVSLNWRSVIARRADNTLVIFPNGQIADRTAEVLRAGESLRITTTFSAPLSVPPQWIDALVTDAVSDLARVDASKPVSVGPLEIDLAAAAIRYRLRCSILDPFEKRDVETELSRRLWYVFQRNEGVRPALAPPVEPPVLAGWIRVALLAGGAAQLGAEAAFAGEALLREGRLLLYAPDERIVLPDGLDDWRFLLVHGKAVASHEYGLDAADPRRPLLPAWSLGADATVRRVADRLARHIGPYAEIAVRRAARATDDFSALCRTVAAEIEDPDERASFLAEVAPPDTVPSHEAGLVFHARRNAAGALICHLALRALGEVAIIGIRPGLLEVKRRAAE